MTATDRQPSFEFVNQQLLMVTTSKLPTGGDDQIEHDDIYDTYCLLVSALETPKELIHLFRLFLAADHAWVAAWLRHNNSSKRPRPIPAAPFTPFLPSADTDPRLLLFSRNLAELAQTLLDTSPSDHHGGSIDRVYAFFTWAYFSGEVVAIQSMFNVGLKIVQSRRKANDKRLAVVKKTEWLKYMERRVPRLSFSDKEGQERLIERDAGELGYWLRLHDEFVHQLLHCCARTDVRFAIRLWLFVCGFGHFEPFRGRSLKHAKSTLRAVLETALLLSAFKPNVSVRSLERAFHRQLRESMAAAVRTVGKEGRSDDIGLKKINYERIIKLGYQRNAGRAEFVEDLLVRCALLFGETPTEKDYVIELMEVLRHERRQRKRRHLLMKELPTRIPAFDELGKQLLRSTGSTPDAVRACARRLIGILPLLSFPWPAQGLIVTLAKETGKAGIVVQEVLQVAKCSLPRAPRLKIPKAYQGLIESKPPLDVLHLLTEIIEELWTKNPKAVADALRRMIEKEPHPAALMTAMLAIKEIIPREMEEGKPERVEEAVNVLSAANAHSGIRRQAAQLIAVALVGEGDPHPHEAIMKMSETGRADEDPVVRLLALLGPTSDAVPQADRLQFIAKCLDGAEADVHQAVQDAWIGSSRTRWPAIVPPLASLLAEADLTRRLLGIFSLARLAPSSGDTRHGFQLYWELVAERLLTIFEDRNPFTVFAAVVALLPVVKRLHPNGWVVHLVQYLQHPDHRACPVMPVCELLEPTLDHRIRCKLMAILGIQSPRSSLALRFASGVLLAEVGSEPEHRDMVLSILREIERSDDAIAHEIVHWVRRRLEFTA